jgi:FlaA1/EpsC-like NDP-sugar epimerase
MKRFFMTIPEATLLIVQAGAFDEAGVVYILDMGEEIEIYELARKLIRLRGHRIDDVKIEFVGPREGEKLTEVLYGPEEKIAKSPHPKIMKILGTKLPDFEVLKRQLEEMKQLATPFSRDKLVNSMKNLLTSCGVIIGTNSTPTQPKPD